MSTIRDVAKRAGVAPITVSRVLNNSGYVSLKTRAKVEAAAHELNYVPNMLARSLRSNETRTLALVLSDITNPFWTTVARGVEDAANSHGYHVIFCNTDENATKQEEYLTVLLQRRVDGVLLVPARSEPEDVRQLQQQGVPTVVLDRRVPGADVDVVRGTSVKGSHRLVDHLLEKGHRHIAVLTGPEAVSTSDERIEGYRQALEAAAIPFDPRLILRGDFSVEGGLNAAHGFLQLEPRPTAIFATNNFLAIGALRALRDAGVAVPGDVSLVAFDDLPEYAVDPWITVVAQPAYEMGRTATELLLRRISGVDKTRPQEVALPTTFIRRSSVKSIVANGANPEGTRRHENR